MNVLNKLKPKLQSFRFHIALLILCMGIIPSFVIAHLFIYYFEQRSLSSEELAISSQAQLLSNQIVTSGYLQDNSVESVNTQLKALGNIYSGRIMVIDSKMKVVKDTYNMYDGRTIVWQNVIESASGAFRSYYDAQNHCVIVTVPITDPTDTSVIAGVLLVNKTTGSLEQNMEYYRSIGVIIGLISVILSTILALAFSRRYVTPIRKMAQSIEHMNQGLTHQELEVSGYTELQKVAEQFNAYADSMYKVDESRQEFVSNVSHELKTPLTSMKVLADSINSMGDGVPVELYQEFMNDITNEIDRETSIINDLLSLVRMDKSGANLNIAPVNLNELIELILKRLKPIAEKQEVELVMESFRPVTVEIDEVKFSLAISNLIENGIKYNNPGGFVHVSLNADHRYCYIRVEDSGMGIPQESLDFIFDRFYRVDKSHSREIGGTGLGLAITKNAINMHHGEIKVSSVVGEGTTFDVRVPLNYIKPEENPS
ncbi:MAG: two-component sensor histidine kinase [Lachnospiraceae bacterium]|nr:two-component sensor histidine kinase [Lachnospiraceae bacterium]